MSINERNSSIRSGNLLVQSSRSASLSNTCKSLLSQQVQRLNEKHSNDLDLIESLRSFIKTKYSIEMNYGQAMVKLCNNHLSRKFPSFSNEASSEVKSLYTAWRLYLEEEDKASKHRLDQYEQIIGLCDLLKQMKTRKNHIGKKMIDQHLKKMHEELQSSVYEIDKARKFYFGEEHMAKQARDKDEKIKKKKGGIFSKFTDLQSKKNKSSAYREASNIQSTMARNEYILALSAGNAHFEHYYSQDLPSLLQILDDGVICKCRDFILTLLKSELSSVNYSNELISSVNQIANSTSEDLSNSIFMEDPSSSCLKDVLQFEFDPCDSDTITTVSIEHNAELALQHEITKWISCYSKECRNLIKLSQQLLKCQTLQNKGEKNVEVVGLGSVDIEARIDDIRQQLRKSDLSKVKAEARLKAIKKGGMPVEDLEIIATQIANELKQSTANLEVNQPLSRTSSLKSSNVAEGRISASEAKSFSEDKQNDNVSETNEKPSYEVDQPNESLEIIKNYQYKSYDIKTWDDYDANAVWNDHNDKPVEEVHFEQIQSNVEIIQSENSSDLSLIVGKFCRSLYPYEAQNHDELSFDAGQIMTIVSVEDQDWIAVRNEKNEVGYIPRAYVDVIGKYSRSGSATRVLYNQSSVTSRNSLQKRDSVIHAPMIKEENEFVQALYEYIAASDEEISFKEGEIFKVLEKNEDGWWLTEKDGKKGYFPSMLVQPVDEASYNEDQVFEESGDSESDDTVDLPNLEGFPPPSFAPPKPAYLTPHQVVIIHSTPEIESKETFGDLNVNVQPEAAEVTNQNEDKKEEDKQENNDKNLSDKKNSDQILNDKDQKNFVTKKNLEKKENENNKMMDKHAQNNTVKNENEDEFENRSENDFENGIENKPKNEHKNELKNECENEHVNQNVNELEDFDLKRKNSKDFVNSKKDGDLETSKFIENGRINGADENEEFEESIK